MRQCAELAQTFSFAVQGIPLAAIQNLGMFQHVFAPVPTTAHDLQGPPTPIEQQGTAGDKKTRASTEAEGGKRKRVKKEKKEKDPNAPKRPPSAYLMFQNEVRGAFKQQFPDLVYHQVLGKISEAWGTMPEADKDVSTLYALYALHL